MGRHALDYNEFVTPYIFEMIPKWKRAGRNDEWIATKIGIGWTTLKKWKSEHEPFKRLFEKGREELLLELEESIYTKAKGYTVKLKSYDVDKDTGEVLDGIVHIQEKHIHSDTALMNSLARLDKEWSKEKLKGVVEDDDKETGIVFSGESDML